MKLERKLRANLTQEKWCKRAKSRVNHIIRWLSNWGKNHQSVTKDLTVCNWQTLLLYWGKAMTFFSACVFILFEALFFVLFPNYTLVNHLIRSVACFSLMDVFCWAWYKFLLQTENVEKLWLPANHENFSRTASWSVSLAQLSWPQLFQTVKTVDFCKDLTIIPPLSVNNQPIERLEGLLTGLWRGCCSWGLDLDTVTH